MPQRRRLCRVCSMWWRWAGQGRRGEDDGCGEPGGGLAKLGYRVGLIDADIYGPNVPTMLGMTRQPNIVGENRIEPLTAHGVKFISVGLISPGDKPMVMRGPMLHQIIRQFLQQVEWGELDFLIVDLPPGTGDVVISLVQTVPLTGAVVVSTGSSVALQDARKALEMFHQVKVEVLGLVENMSQMTLPDGDGARCVRRGRDGADGEAVWAGVSGVGGAGSGGARGRRPRAAGGAGGAESKRGEGVCGDCEEGGGAGGGDCGEE